MKLARALLRAHLNYDPKTGEFTRKDGTPVATDLTWDGYLKVIINRDGFRAHRLAFLYMTGEMPDQVDHINRCRTDNRWENLRAANNSQNVTNSGPRPKNKSGIKGIYRDRNRWRAEIIKDGIRYRLGSFETPEAAGAVYRDAAEKLHGEFAYPG